MKLSIGLTTALVLQAFAATVFAQSLSCDKTYGFRADSNGVTGSTICSSTAENFIDAAKNFNLSNHSYTQTSAALVQGRFNDVNLTLSYAANSTTLQFSSQQLAVNESFSGATRKESENKFVDYLKKSNIIGRLMKAQAKTSATSPLAGVGGLLPTMAANDFSNSFDTASKIASGQTGSVNNQIGIAPSFGSYKIDGSSDNVSTISIPLSYAFRSNEDPRRQVILSLPITQVSVGDAKSYHTGLGIAYRLPVNDHWTLTPAAKYALVASVDRATVATAMSGSLMSTYVIPMSGFDLAIGNMLGYYQTGKFSTGEYSFDPDIKQIMLRNGVMLSQPVSISGNGMAIEYSLVDTRYTGGDKPFLAETQEIGVTIGNNRATAGANSFLRGGITYLHAKHANGFNVNIGYWF